MSSLISLVDQIKSPRYGPQLKSNQQHQALLSRHHGICSESVNTFPFQMTGRKGRVVRRPDGTVRYESRAEQGLTIDHINIKEKDRFMSGEKVRCVGVQK